MITLNVLVYNFSPLTSSFPDVSTCFHMIPCSFITHAVYLYFLHCESWDPLLIQEINEVGYSWHLFISRFIIKEKMIHKMFFI